MKKNSKEAIVEAAISLFTTKGYAGTSMRDIAEKSNVNISTISYYFQNKHGLLEHCFTTFFEQYMAKVEVGYTFIDQGASLCLKRISSDLLHFLCENILLSSFIFREMSLDSQVVREIMSTYYAKEKFYLQRILEKGMERKEIRPQSIAFIIVQLKSFWMMPFLNAPYLREVLYIFPNEHFFVKKYAQEVNKWIDDVLCQKVAAPLSIN
ncbi:forespore capture DNA-binding protein RefZ [Neobacillus sp. PS3-40]|uniref:forespore capture DNA-binding protein RefZ n=1 Tax=Neobacillus sp. PS3-40 TaxID=3070679 RepID=UPI0027E080CA|nr:forespore capture DNA-binding protein RefZ [Neobacillus sp. PS3-40]WML45670.1 forespore capture DNA-binding protein RefZ [Neobacillus sp. PS3-40]